MPRFGNTCRVLFAILPLLGCVNERASAGDFPTQTVRIISTGPGGSSDTFARVIAAELSGIWKKPVVVENKAGAGVILSTMTVANAPPDGHTLLINTASFVVSSVTAQKPLYDPVLSFAPVAMIGKGPLLLVASPQLAASSLSELMRLANKQPDAITFASTGPGAVTHLAAELLFQKGGARARHIPYRSGNQATTAVLGGHTDLYLGTVSASLPLVKDGKLKALAVTSAKRSMFAPNVPTVAEQGLPDFNMEMWWAILAPVGTPPDVTAEINRTINQILKQPKVLEFLHNEGAEPAPMTIDQLASLLRSETERWREIVDSSGFEKQ